MAALPWPARILAALAVLLVAAYYGVRLHDGPLGALPGGPFVADPSPDALHPTAAKASS